MAGVSLPYGSASPEVVAIALLIGVLLVGTLTLAGEAVDRLNLTLPGLVVAFALPFAVPLLAIVVAQPVVGLRQAIDGYSLSPSAASLLIASSVVAAGSRCRLWFVEPGLFAVLKDRGLWRSYVANRWRWTVVKWGSYLIATWGVALLVFGTGSVARFWQQRIENVWHALPLT